MTSRILHFKQATTSIPNAMSLNSVIIIFLDKIRSTTCHYSDFSSNPICSLTPIYKEIANDDIKVSIDGHGGRMCLMGYPEAIAAAIEISPLKKRTSVNSK